MHDESKPPHADLNAGPFWRVFSQSRIPMALVDRDRRYVDVNDAAIDIFQYPRAEVLGSLAGRTAVDDPSITDVRWAQLVLTDELYGERVVAHANGSQMRVSYAAHATSVGGCWLALFVTLSARFRDGGPEMIAPAQLQSPSSPGSKLTPRERQVVRQVALGCDTRRIAADLCVSPETIRTHVRNAMSKTGAHTRAQLVALALAGGLITAMHDDDGGAAARDP